ncbi:MAG: UDP-3-O-(3-hydroxymyristoyl)glucosamine N-acyltransferase [Hyphomicrobiaceae bacterium]
MEHPGFFRRMGPFPLGDMLRACEAELTTPDLADRLVHDIRPLAEAGPEHLAFFENRKYVDQLKETRAGACFLAPQFVDRLPPGVAALVTRTPYRSYALALARFYPEAAHPRAAECSASEAIGGVHASAEIEDGAVIEPGAVVGREARIGRGSVIAAGAVIGYRVCVGRNSFVGPGAVLTHALVGDGVIVHAGVKVGQDGFGFAMGPGGHLKVPQIGRVIIQDKVEIGANSTVDRGALKDTVIGEGTKIDNLVQIGHNVMIGRHCVIVGQTGISGSVTIEDYVVMGGQSGAVGHIRIGKGAQIAGGCHAKNDVPPGAKMGGTPARPFREWAREVAAVRQLGLRHRGRTED